MPGIKENASGRSGGVGFATSAAIARESIPRSAAYSPALLNFVLAPPPVGEDGDGSEGLATCSVVSLHSSNHVFALPCQLNGLPQLADLFCSVPVSVPVSVSVAVPVSVPVKPSVTVASFAPLAPVSEVSPLQLDQFWAELGHHSNESAIAYVVSGLRDGFRIGFDPTLVSLQSASSNMRSASEHPSVIDSYLQN